MLCDVFHKFIFLLLNSTFYQKVYKVAVENIPCDPTSNLESLYNTNFEKVGGIEIVGDYCVVPVLDWAEGFKLAVKSLKEPGNSHQEIKVRTHPDSSWPAKWGSYNVVPLRVL